MQTKIENIIKGDIMNSILKEINDMGWWMMFSWQMADGVICMVFRRAKTPQFVVSWCGKDESRILGEILKNASWIEGFAKEYDIDAKYVEYLEQKNESIKYVKENMEKYGDVQTPDDF